MEQHERVAHGRKIGEKIYPALPEGTRQVIDFGMVPIDVVDMIQDTIRNRFASKFLSAEHRQDVLQDFTEGFTLGLFDGAELAGTLRV